MQRCVGAVPDAIGRLELVFVVARLVVPMGTGQCSLDLGALGLRARVGVALARRVVELLLLDTTISQEGAQRDGVAHARRRQNLDRRPHGAHDLSATLLNDLGHTVQRDADGEQCQTEEQDEQDLALPRDLRGHNDGDGEGDEQQVGEDVAAAHDEHLREALATFAARVGNHLPVVREGLALDQVGDDDGDKGCHEGDAHAENHVGVKLLPRGTSKTAKEVHGGELDDPKTGGVVSFQDASPSVI